MKRKSSMSPLPGTYRCDLLNGRDRFTVTLRPDGSVTYMESRFSSYIGDGSYRADNGILTFTNASVPEGKSVRSYGFKVAADGLIFCRDLSDEFVRSDVPDGALFVGPGTAPTQNKRGDAAFSEKL